MQSSITWFISQLSNVIYNPLQVDGYSKAVEKIYAQAIEMHHQEIIDAFSRGAAEGLFGEGASNKEQYYQETFKKD
jgi:hypothetical protein